jgi:hypothetical protein
MEYVFIIAVYLVVLAMIISFNHGAHENDQDDYELYESGSSLQTNDALENVEIVLVADDDFLEHLHEMGFEDTIDIGDALLEWHDWAAENVE